MSDWWMNFHFLRPILLVLLVIPLFIGGKYLQGSKNKSSWEKVIDNRLLKYLLIKGSSGQRKFISWAAVTGLVFAIIAVAGPSWEKQEIPYMENENPLMIVLNMSSDMKVRDLKPNRLERSKYKIRDLMQILPETQSSLMVYSGEPFVISPFSNDGKIIANLTEAIDFDIMPLNGDRLDRALDEALQSFVNAGYRKGEILVIAPDIGQEFEKTLSVAQKIKQKGFNISVLNSSNHDNKKLKILAEKGDGKYALLSGSDDDLRILKQEFVPKNQELKSSQNKQSVWLDYGYYVVIVPLICCLYFFRKGILAVIFLLGIMPEAQAGFWKSDNHEGLSAFEQNDFATAADKFRDSEWKAAAYYRQQNYEAAYKEYAKKQDSESLYNQGNSLAKSGKIEEAIKKYEEVLKKVPNHKDAKFNLEYLKQQQKQKKQSADNKQNEDKNKDSQQQNQSKPNNQEDSDQNKEQSQENKQEQELKQNQNQNKNQNQGQNQDNQSSQQSDGNEKKDNNAAQNQQSEPTQSVSNEAQQPRQDSKQDLTSMQNDMKDKKELEKIQARAQQYREIPEDNGGLLKAFIYKEFKRNRYAK